MMSHVNVNIGGCVCVSGCLKCIYEKDLEKKKSKTCEDGFGYLVNLTAVMSVISSLRKKMLSYISSVHLWPADQSMRDFWVRGFWKNLPLGINPEHSCVKTKIQNVLIHVHSDVKGSSSCLHLYNDLLTVPMTFYVSVASSASCILKKNVHFNTLMCNCPFMIFK